jgi:cysteinyl-tRNA synthetase
MDFILWKAEKPGEPTWQSPWGPGRPGWHIEDTAITTKYFGDQYDIHGGARDLIFPHHESEIAIAESATGKKPFVKYWFHTGFLNVEGDKMSKSLGNFFTIQDVLKKYDSEVIRFFLLYTHYRSPIDFAEKNLEEAASSFNRLKNSMQKLKQIIKSLESKAVDTAETSNKENDLLKEVEKHHDQFLAAMDDDFNTREAIATLFEFSHTINKYFKSSQEADGFTLKTLNKVYDTFIELANILGLFEFKTISLEGDSSLNEKLIQVLINLRQKLRAEKNFQLADQLRDQLKELGVKLEDSQTETTWKFEG